MKASLENTSPLQRKLNIEVPVAEVQAAFERALKGVQKHAAVKGFRKGKAPITAVRSLYGDRIREDVVQEIISSNYANALKEHSLEPISYPTIEFDPLEDDKDFSFSAEFEVRPEVKINQLEGLVVKKEKMNFDEKSVENTINEIRAGRAETTPVFEDRAAQAGDVAVIDFKGFIDGRELENGAAQDHELELGSNTFIPGFEEGVIGMRPGGTGKINATFPAEYHVAELAGKPVEFEVALKSLKKKVLPELNDEFAKSVGPYESLDALRTAIREDFQKREQKRIDDDLKNRLMRVLVDRNPVPVPKGILAEQKKSVVDDFEKRMKQQGMPEQQFEEYKKLWDSDFEKTASYMVQSSFLIDAISAQQNLRATDQDLAAKLRQYAEEGNIDLNRLSEFYKDPNRRSQLTYQVTEEKVLEYLISKAQIVELPPEQIEKDGQ